MKDWPFNWDYLRPYNKSSRPASYWRAAVINPYILEENGLDPETLVLVWQNMSFKGNEFANTPLERVTIEITAS
jgi:hypothetical protein